MRMAVEKPDKRLHGFEGVFNANVFSVPAVHIESKMIIFTSELRPYAQQSAKRIGEVNCCKISDFFFR